MPNLTTWSNHFQAIVNTLGDHFKTVPEGVDWPKLREIEDRIQALWASEDSTWPEFQEACAAYKIFWWGYHAQNG